MAGGAGTRFWPESRIDKPKQFHKLIGEKTMLQSTVERILPIIPHERILVVTNASYTGLVQEQLPELPAGNIIGEPVGRNTAPCIACAAAILMHRDPSATMIVLPADHYIRNEVEFRKILDVAAQKAEQDECLVTIGILPHRPETGYGYIQQDEKKSGEIGGRKVSRVKTFAEKPDLQTAVGFIESGDFLWNSGMFIWKARDIWAEFEKYLPQIFIEARKLLKNHAKDGEAAIGAFYQSVNSISIDYGIMEKTDAVYVIPAEFGWSDVGSWMAIYELEKKDVFGNVVRTGKGLMENCQNCFISSNGGKLVAMVGLMGVGYIETEDAVLICSMDKSQNVRNIVDKLEESGHADLK